jgi:hypothetical protein
MCANYMQFFISKVLGVHVYTHIHYLGPPMHTTRWQGAKRRVVWR